MRIKALIFDVDGVLFDSLEANTEYYRLLLNKAGYHPSIEDIESCFHKTLIDSISYLANTEDKKEIKRIWDMAHNEKFYPRDLLKFPFMMSETLKSLSQTYKLGIATNRIKSGLEDVLNEVNSVQYFDEIVAFGDYKSPKPHPEPLLKAAKLLHVDPRESVYIGDSHTDIEAAKAAGMKSIHLSSEKHGDADAGITEFRDLPSALAKLDI